MDPVLNPRVSRRGVLTSLAGLAVGIAGLAYPGIGRVLAAQPRPSSMPDTAENDRGFAGGRVEFVTADSLVLTNAEYTRIVRIPPGSTVWKEFDVALDQVKIGDRVQARGVLQEDGSLLARPGWVWVNIATWHGEVLALRSNGLLTRRRNGMERELVFSRRLEVISGKDLSPIPAGARALVIGSHLGAVGLSMPDRSLRATRIWIDS